MAGMGWMSRPSTGGADRAGAPHGVGRCRREPLSDGDVILVTIDVPGEPSSAPEPQSDLSFAGRKMVRRQTKGGPFDDVKRAAKLWNARRGGVLFGCQPAISRFTAFGPLPRLSGSVS